MGSVRLGLVLAGLVATLSSTSVAAGATNFQPEGSGVTYPAQSNGRLTSVPSITAYRLAEGEEVSLDGRLDDAVWDNAESGVGFRVWDPDRGADPSQETVFKIAYDDGNVYVAVAAFETDLSLIVDNLARRDRIDASDVISIYLDPYLDRVTGYNFRTNPSGVQVDSYMFNDGDRDVNWNAVWDVETSKDENGWYAEFRIPFRAMRYRPQEDMTWGLQVYRYMHGRGEDTSWTTWDRQSRGFISRFGTVTGLRDVPAPRQLEILPYFLTQSVDASAPNEVGDKVASEQNFGTDLKYGVTADLTLNATLNPDFGQVEADPATLNLSPFETFFEEKRPFFVEGNRFFQHPDFNLFYSRRIGTGSPFSRIITAGKLTGKTKNNVSIGALVAATDEAVPSHANNIFRSDGQRATYAVGRLGKEFNDANYKFNVMGTAALKSADRLTYGDRASREAYTGGLDFDLNFKDREYNIQGSAVTSYIDHESLVSSDISASTTQGHGGSLDVRKVGGNLQGGTWFNWESDKLQLNDLGFLGAPDEYGTGLWAQYRYNPEGESKVFNQANFNFNFWRSWIFASRSGTDINTGETVWTYQGGNPQFIGTNVNGWMQFRNYYEAWWGVEVMPEGTQRWETRGGPLIREPTTYGGWWGASTDTRKPLRLYTEGNYFRDSVGNRAYTLELGGRWNQTSAINYEFEVGFRDRTDDTQYLETVNLNNRPGGVGIGGLSYVFGDIHQQTFDFTLRGNLLFTRDMSLELYLQPFITTGEYARVRELAAPDSYDLIPYDEEGYTASQNDFTFSSVNLNAVWRWQYRPGSTLFLVWTHARQTYDERNFHDNPSHFEAGLQPNVLFLNEPENVFMAKVTYWFSL